jgi:hypothetical protein
VQIFDIDGLIDPHVPHLLSFARQPGNIAQFCTTRQSPAERWLGCAPRVANRRRIRLQALVFLQ